MTWDSSGKKRDSLPAVSGIEKKRSPKFQNDKEGTIPAGVWYLERKNLKVYTDPYNDLVIDAIEFFKGIKGDKISRYWCKVTADKNTETYEREEFWICGGDTEYSKGNICIGKEISEFISEFSDRVHTDDKIALKVQYRPFYEISRYQEKSGTWIDLLKGGKGDDVKSLQEDLFNLGYWVTRGLTVPEIGKPMVFGGSFDDYLYSAIKTFQLEHKEEGRLAIGKAANHPCTTSYLFHQSFKSIVSSNSSPVLLWKYGVGKRFFQAVADFFPIQGVLKNLHTTNQ